MQITLNQDEIELAIKSYVASQIVLREGQDIAVDLKAGRGENGFTATLDIRAPTGVTVVKGDGPAVASQAETSKPAAEPKEVKAEKVTGIFGKKATPAKEEPKPEPEPEPEPAAAEEPQEEEENQEPEISEGPDDTKETEETDDAKEEAPAKPAGKSIFSFANK